MNEPIKLRFYGTLIDVDALPKLLLDKGPGGCEGMTPIGEFLVNKKDEDNKNVCKP